MTNMYTKNAYQNTKNTLTQQRVSGTQNIEWSIKRTTIDARARKEKQDVQL